MSRSCLPWPAALPTLLAALALSIVGCAALKESRPTWPVKEYEKLIAGRLDADYIGTASCLAKCHQHDGLARDFRLSIHGEQVSAETGLPLVNCESCHGPGSLAVAEIKDGKCDASTFIPLEKIPAGAQVLICLKCHAAQSTSNLAAWPSSLHASAGVSCLDCHKLHKGPAQKVRKSEIAALCMGCHKEQRVEFSMPSHHPVPEGRMTCVDCHDQHGTTNDHNLRTATERQGCGRCHPEKSGPFVFEHANLMQECAACHNPHGAANSRLLRYASPFLCLQCHNGHSVTSHVGSPIGLNSAGSKAVFFSRCTTCHPRIHGTDVKGSRNDDRLIR